MKKVIFILIFSCIALMSVNVSANSRIYDEEKEVIYFAYFPVVNMRMLAGQSNNRIKKLDVQELEAELRKLYKIRLTNEKAEVILVTNNPITSYSINKKKYIAASTMDLKSLKTYFHIYTSDANEIKSFENITWIYHGKKDFAWSLDGSMVAFIKGVPDEDSEVFPYDIQGIFIYNLKTGEAKKLDTRGSKIEWAAHDNKLYVARDIRNDEGYFIGIYDPATDKYVKKSSNNGVVYSPDGKHYIGEIFMEVQGERGSRFALFDSKDNKELYAFNTYGERLFAFRFIDNKHLLNWNTEGQYKLYDITTKKIIRSSDKAPMLGWNEDLSKLVVYNANTDKINIIETISGKLVKEVDLPK